MSAALESLMRRDPHKEPDAPLFRGLLAFVVIGIVGAGAFVLLSSSVVSMGTGVADWLISAACYASLIGPVYLLHRRYSFGSVAPHAQALPRYIAVQGMALLLTALFSYVVHGVLVMPTLFASMLVIVLTSGVNFIVLRSWAFARSQIGVVVAA